MKVPLKAAGLRLFWRLAGLSGGILSVCLSGCDESPKTNASTTVPVAVKTGAQTKQQPVKGELFTDITLSAGIKNPQQQWPDGKFLTPEITPGGVALFDYDNDGDLDIYQVNHAPPGSFTTPAPNRLYQQQADHSFVEIPGAAGLADSGFGHGVAVGDIDNDGDLDVFVTNYGQNRLYVNEGGKFSDQTFARGIRREEAWSSSTGFLDYDRDGFLDLYVVRFAVFDPNKKCKSLQDGKEYDYCGPHMFDGLIDTLYHNNGDGTFTDVTEKAGINTAARGWGLACADLTGDGWCDVYVANDEEPAQLWVNQHDGTFVDEAVLRGCAFNGSGRVEAGMGVAIGDIDDDGRLDLYKTHISSETNTLFLSSAGGKAGFADNTAASGMGGLRSFTGWGTGFFDFDHDGDLDIAVANGRVARGAIHAGGEKLGPFWKEFAEPKLLHENDGHGHFTNISDKTGGFGAVPHVTRGLAFADLDGDGDIDMVAQDLDNTLHIYRNDAVPANRHWLMVQTKTGKRDAYGAVVTIDWKGKQLTRLAHPAYSFLSSNDPRAHFGLDDVDRVESLRVDWPSGKSERFKVPGIDRVIVVEEGKGESIDAVDATASR